MPSSPATSARRAPKPEAVVATAPTAEGQFVAFPDSPFQLYQPYPPAGDQPTAIDQLVEGVENGESGNPP